MKNVFEMDYDVERILSALKVECGKKIEAEDTCSTLSASYVSVIVHRDFYRGKLCQN
ncbi:MAG: hypothetical protein K2J99_13875 [Lachnospiraceae bacterium]|nr:hypothetical protein [Lachnospiraceae bacterium]